MIHIAKIHDIIHGDDDAPSTRVLVDRLWPRGIKKDAVENLEWLKDVAPSPDLRTWFNHDPELFPEFSRRYKAELDGGGEAVDKLKKLADGELTLVYAAKDRDHNHALVLKEWLEKK